jgi:hypothetical protein
MTDSDKTKEKKVVRDEAGLQLVETLSDGPWNDEKTDLLRDEMSFNREYRESLIEAIEKSVHDTSHEELADVFSGVVSFLMDSSMFEKLKQPILNGSTFIDALTNLLQTDYFSKDRSVNKAEESAPQQESDVVSDDDYIFNEANKHAGRFKNIISKWIHNYKAEMYFVEQLGEDKIDLAYKHYCHLLLKDNEYLLKSIKLKVASSTMMVDAIIEHFRSSYVGKCQEFSTKDEMHLFFQLLESPYERDSYLWENQEEEYRKIVIGKLKQLFTTVSDFVQFDDITDALMEKFKSHFTGNNGKFIWDYSFEEHESFGVWCHKLIKEYIEAKFDTAWKLYLSVKTLERQIYVDKDYTEFGEKISELFQEMRLDLYVRKAWELDEKENLDPIYRHYCRYLLNDDVRLVKDVVEKEEKAGKTKETAIIIALIQNFTEDYMCKWNAPICSKEDRSFFCGLLSDPVKRNNFLWFDRKPVYETEVKNHISYLFASLGLDNACVEIAVGPLMNDLESYFTKGNNSLWDIQNYSFEKNIEDWSLGITKEKIKAKCKNYIDKHLAGIIKRYYLLDEKDLLVRYQRTAKFASKYIRADELDGEVRKMWKMEGKGVVDTSMVYDHYFYTLVNGKRKSLEKVLGAFSKTKDRKNGLERILKVIFVNDFMNYLADGAKQMSVKKNRDQFFLLLKESSERDKFLWPNQGVGYEQMINDEVESAYSHMIFTTITKDPGRLAARQHKIKEAAKTLKEDLKSFLTGDGGWAFVRNYSFNKTIKTWLDFVIKNYIGAKPRIDLFIHERDTEVLRFYIKNEFGKNFVVIYNDFTRLGSSSVKQKEKGGNTEKTHSSNRRKKVSDVNDIADTIIQDFVEYFYGVETEGRVRKINTEWGCEKQFHNFRYESKLSSYMHDICYHYFLRLVKNEFPKTGLKPKKKISKQEKENQTSTQNDKILKKLGLKPKQNLALVKEKDYIPDLDVVINSVLVDYAWLFFGFRKENFNKTTEMHDSFQELANKGEDWKFFDSTIVTFGISDLKDIQGLDDKDIKVLPKLVASCHIKFARYYSKSGGIALRNKEKTDYKTLALFYDTKPNHVIVWDKRWKQEFQNNLYPFFDVFYRRIESCEESEKDKIYKLIDGIPAVLSAMSHLFLPESKLRARYIVKQSDETIEWKRDCLQRNKTNLLTDKDSQLTDGQVIANKLMIDNLSTADLVKFLETRLWNMNVDDKKARQKKEEKGKI